MHNLARRLEKIEAKTGAHIPKGVLAIEETDEDGRVTGYRFGGYYPGNCFFPRNEGEGLQEFGLRAERHAEHKNGGEVLRIVVRFVPAENGRPVRTNA